jgi:hypothetical protein
VFFGPWQLPVHQPNGSTGLCAPTLSWTGWSPWAEPTPARAGDPKLRKGQGLSLRPFPMRWQQRLDLPYRDHIPVELLDAWDTWAEDRDDATELTFDGTKVGGWPYCLQARCAGRRAIDRARTATTSCSLTVSARPGCGGGTPGWATVASLAAASTTGT